jgi:hypothetical protein
VRRAGMVWELVLRRPQGPVGYGLAAISAADRWGRRRGNPLMAPSPPEADKPGRGGQARPRGEARQRRTSPPEADKPATGGQATIWSHAQPRFRLRLPPSPIRQRRTRACSSSGELRRTDRKRGYTFGLLAPGELARRRRVAAVSRAGKSPGQDTDLRNPSPVSPERSRSRPPERAPARRAGIG